MVLVCSSSLREIGFYAMVGRMGEIGLLQLDGTDGPYGRDGAGVGWRDRQ